MRSRILYILGSFCVLLGVPLIWTWHKDKTDSLALPFAGLALLAGAGAVMTARRKA